MGHVQLRSVLARELHREPRALETSLGAAYRRVQRHVGVVAIGRAGSLHVAVYDGCVFTMNHDRHAGGAEDALQSIALVDEHVACRRAHEELYARYAVGVEPVEEGHIGICGTEEERMVDVTFARGQGKLVVKRLQCRGLRHGVRHVENGGHATCRRRPALAFHVGLVCKAGLTEMHMVVDDARQNVTARSVYRHVERRSGPCAARIYAFNVLTTDGYGRFGRLSLIHHQCVFYQYPHLCLVL